MPSISPYHPNAPRPYPRVMRVLAWIVLLAFLAGCSKDVVRGPMETRHYSVNMEQLDAQRIAAGALEIESVVLTPAQWPLETSMKNLFQGDFIGVFDNFDLSFRSSRLRGDTLERLFDAGYLPAFVKVRNTGELVTLFSPGTLVVKADKDTEFYPVSAESLPGRFREIDWARTGVNVVLVALVVALVVASAKEGRSGGSGFIRMTNPNLNLSGSRRGGRGRVRKATQPSAKGLLRGRALKPGESVEGFVFFQLDRTVADWTTARIGANP